MKTIIENFNKVSKYLFADDKAVSVEANCIKVGDISSFDFIILDLNSNNATLIENVSEPLDWCGCKYKYINDAWEVSPDWVEPSEAATE
jgi:hypothetical protein